MNSNATGLTTEEARQRLEQLGPNLLEAREKAAAAGLFLKQFESPIVLILLFATAVSAVVQDRADVINILAIVLGNAGLSFVRECNAYNTAEKLRARVDDEHHLRQQVQRGRRGACPAFASHAAHANAHHVFLDELPSDGNHQRQRRPRTGEEASMLEHQVNPHRYDSAPPCMWFHAAFAGGQIGSREEITSP